MPRLTPGPSSHSIRDAALRPRVLSPQLLLCLLNSTAPTSIPNSQFSLFRIPVTGMTHSSHILEVKFSQLLRVIQKYNSHTRIIQRKMGRDVGIGCFKSKVEKLLNVQGEAVRTLSGRFHDTSEMNHLRV